MEVIKKGAVILLAMSLVCPISGPAQNQNTANKISNTANEIGNTANEISNTAKTIVGLFKRKKNNTEESNATDVTNASVSGESSFAEEAFRIITNHPDFKIKVLRCEASGSTCVIDMIIGNAGSQDVIIEHFYGGNYGSIAYDDEANQYDRKNILVAIGNSQLTNSHYMTNLPAGISLKARIQIEGVPASVRMFRRIDLIVVCNQWNINSEKPVKLFNVPISREGDE